MERLSLLGIAAGIFLRFWPVWLALALILVLSFIYQRRLGPYGHVINSGVGLAGVLLCLFWLLTALLANVVAPFEPLDQIAVMKHALPGSVEPQSHSAFLLGGDKLARDVFSRMIHGSRIVLAIAPAATAISLLVGSLLGLPAGFYGGKVDAILSFIANLVLAFRSRDHGSCHSALRSIRKRVSDTASESASS